MMGIEDKPATTVEVAISFAIEVQQLGQRHVCASVRCLCGCGQLKDRVTATGRVRAMARVLRALARRLEAQGGLLHEEADVGPS